MKPKYKVGDIVTIKKKREGDPGNYRFSFTNIMLEKYGGKSFRITSAEFYSDNPDDYPKKDDGYIYALEGISWNWASSMFEDSSEALSLETSIDNSLDAFIAKKKCPELDFTL